MATEYVAASDELVAHIDDDSIPEDKKVEYLATGEDNVGKRRLERPGHRGQQVHSAHPDQVRLVLSNTVAMRGYSSRGRVRTLPARGRSLATVKRATGS